MSPGPIVLAAGGTGGHMYPAESLALRLRARGHRLVLVTDERGAVHGSGLTGVQITRIRAGTPLAGSARQRAKALRETAIGLLQARRLLRNLAPSAVVGFGGYPALPTMLAAAWRGLPTLLHEQNAVLGRVNRLLARHMLCVALSFPATARLPTGGRLHAEVVGNPTRPATLVGRARRYTAPTGDGPVRLLVLGGSQGAEVFSQVVPRALSLLPAHLRARLRVAQQCRSESLTEAQRLFQEAGVSTDVAPFFHDAATRIAEAHVVICRAGASTVAELQVVGRPAILVPLPGAADDHQTANARAAVNVGAGWLVPQEACNPQALATLLQRLLQSASTLDDAAARSRRAGRPDAADELATLVERLLTLRSERQASRPAAGNTRWTVA